MSGRLGDAVFFTRFGAQYARRYVSPANPDTAGQRLRRSMFRHAVRSWQNLDREERLSWNRKAAKGSMSGYNLYISYFLKKDVAATRQVLSRKKEGVSFESASVPLRFIAVPVPLSPGFAKGSLIFYSGP